MQIRNILQIDSGKKFDRLHYPNISKELDRHLIRGFLDGDGSISSSGRISFFSMSKNGSISSSGRISFFSMSKNFLREISEKVNQHTGIKILKISQSKNKCYRLSYQKGTAKKLGKYATIFMERKKREWEKM